MARRHPDVHDALGSTEHPSSWSSTRWEPSAEEGSTPLAGSLDVLAVDILETPGAGGALLAAFAEQTRALHLVAEAVRRTPDAPLPPAVLASVLAALAQAPTAATPA
jgi:hypothetical protein